MNPTRERGIDTQTALSGTNTADHAMVRAGETLEGMASTLREKAPEEGTLGGVANSVADYMDAAGSYLQESGISGALDDVETLMRRYPVQTLLLGFGLGYFLARTKAR